MKALTVYQPWCSLIIAEAKLVEWRGWACPRSLVGQRIALHASARHQRAGGLHDILDRIDEGETSLIGAIARPIIEGQLLILEKKPHRWVGVRCADCDRPYVRGREKESCRPGSPTNLPRSSVLGTAVIGEPMPALEWVRQHRSGFLDSDRVDHSKFAWPLTDVQRFEPPIPARGAQGFWPWTPPSDAETGP
jgi:hypothetical protein